MTHLFAKFVLGGGGVTEVPRDARLRSHRSTHCDGEFAVHGALVQLPQPIQANMPLLLALSVLSLSLTSPGSLHMARYIGK
jgi:hypothetical protein